jgi:hypothetical protein
MPIPVLCGGCGSRFTVSDKFAGQTGPCPKCKKPIKVPVPAVKSVTIHEAEPAIPTAPGQRPLTVPFKRVEKPISGVVWALIGVGAILTLFAAWALGRTTQPQGPPAWALLAGAFAVAVPCVVLGYAAVRERELEPYRGRSLLLRVLICSLVYTLLWGVKGMLPPDATTEMWQWVFLGPLFFLPGALAALATLDLDWGPAIAHFSFYVIVTALLRWLVGLPPL